MTKIIKAVKYFVIGVLLGSFSFLLILLFSDGMLVESKSVLSLFLFSGLIGLVSMIFKTEWFNFPIRLLIHLLVTIVIVCLMMYFAGWWNLIVVEHIPSFGITFALIYIVVWIMLYLADVTNTKKINDVIQKRKAK
ncbi:DUF3021 domain-containing protein [Companilactobacillus baiquanensis]|uniref:DUF3021 domain-containing protein n=1 Tax=Companilactobacillus baiquanensis TaxID=2486005 RepID=A0ABW1UTG3_9LACO|nr:DUF3021 domain-containing protein [Companilactobacillus baiquanensis]